MNSPFVLCLGVLAASLGVAVGYLVVTDTFPIRRFLWWIPGDSEDDVPAADLWWYRAGAILGALLGIVVGLMIMAEAFR